MPIATLAIVVLLTLIAGYIMVADELAEYRPNYTRYKIISNANGKYEILLFDIPDIDLFVDELRKQLEDRNLGKFSIHYEIEDATFSIPLDISVSNADNDGYIETIIKQSIFEVCSKIKKRSS